MADLGVNCYRNLLELCAVEAAVAMATVCLHSRQDLKLCGSKDIVYVLYWSVDSQWVIALQQWDFNLKKSIYFIVHLHMGR